MRRAWLFCLTLAACVPDGSERDRFPGTRSDGGVSTSSTADAGFSADGGVADAGASADGGEVAPYCGDQRCDPDETCATCAVDCGPCECSFGFELFEGRCAPIAPEPFVSRLESEICERWRTDYVTDVGTEWTMTFGSTDPCDPGEVTEASLANALRRTNLYRWVCGLGRVDEDPSRRDQQQACAVVQHAMGGLDHTPDSSVACWTQEGYNGASSSNLAYAGGGGLARSVDLYVGDQGVDSLGHRRWVLNPTMVDTTFGYKPPFSCMYSFSRGQNTPLDVQAYPPPGYVPQQAAPGLWSFRMDSVSFVAETTSVELNIDDGGWAPVDAWVVGGGYGAGPVLAWDNPSGAWSAGTIVQVRLTNAGGDTYTYAVIFVDC